MPYNIRWEDKGVYAYYHGHFTEEEMRRVSQEFKNDARLAVAAYMLHDFLDCENVSTCTLTARSLAANDSELNTLNHILKIAIVTTNPDVMQMTSNYLKFSLSPHEFRLFHDMSEAREWCNT